MTVSDGSYVVLQKGDGDVIEEGDRVCAQGIALNVKDGTELMDTWTKNTPDCSLKVDSKTLSSTYYNQIKGAKINTTIGFGVNAQDSSGYSYILAMTFVSKSKDLEKATGEEVKDVLANLPKVTRAKNGEPSTGWLTNGKQFDSSWDRDSTIDADLFSDSSGQHQVIEGWQKGLVGQTVGSQVLLVIPPDQAYGDKEQGPIPANSTLVFVVDILAAY